jgi:hypothetical protein
MVFQLGDWAGSCNFPPMLRNVVYTRPRYWWVLVKTALNLRVQLMAGNLLPFYECLCFMQLIKFGGGGGVCYHTIKNLLYCQLFRFDLQLKIRNRITLLFCLEVELLNVFENRILSWRMFGNTLAL